jgi:hypothetical protein
MLQAAACRFFTLIRLTENSTSSQLEEDELIKEEKKPSDCQVLKSYWLPMIDPSNVSGKLISQPLSKSSWFNHDCLKLVAIPCYRKSPIKTSRNQPWSKLRGQASP